MTETISVRNAKKVFGISCITVVFVVTCITVDVIGYIRLETYTKQINTTDTTRYTTVTESYITQTDDRLAYKMNYSTIAIDIKNGFKQIKTRVAFLKVHKAGSTTMQNLFFRFGLRHKLNIRLPTLGNALSPLSKSVPLPPGQHFDIFACHTIYNKKWFDSILPADSVRIGIVREPISRMQSAAYYYLNAEKVGYLKRVPKYNFIHNLVKFPEKYDRNFFSRTRNAMGRDFGFDAYIRQGDKSIESTLSQLNREFSLVMVVEKIHESLVLLKRMMNWSFVDIVYLNSNSNKHKHVVLNNYEKAKFRKTSFLDFQLYEYFLNVLETKIKNADNNFQGEVRLFKTILNNVSDFCSENKNSTDNAKLVIDESEWDDTFQIFTSDCVWMQTDELHFIDTLRSNKLYMHGGVQ